MKKFQGKLRIVKLDKMPKIGMLAINDGFVLNMPADEDDCIKSASYFGNKLAKVMVGTKSITDPDLLKDIYKRVKFDKTLKDGDTVKIKMITKMVLA